MTITKPKTRTITLTGRPPVRVSEDKWGLIACAAWDSGGALDRSMHYQAKSRGELDECTLRVRENEEKTRWIVYGTYSLGLNNSRDGLSSAGELIDDRDDIPSAIERVGKMLGAKPQLIASCIANLPAIEL